MEGDHYKGGEIESILNSVKKKCGLDPEIMTEFDADIIDAINAGLNVLTQMGIGPDTGFVIHGSTEKWTDFFGDDVRLYACKTYVTDRCRLIFDSASMSGTVVQMIQDRIKEFEWRMNIVVESPQSFPPIS